MSDFVVGLSHNHVTHLVIGFRSYLQQVCTLFIPAGSTMPVLKIITNLSRDKIPADFLEKATDFLAKLLEKDKKVWGVIIDDTENTISVIEANCEKYSNYEHDGFQSAEAAAAADPPTLTL